MSMNQQVKSKRHITLAMLFLLITLVAIIVRIGIFLNPRIDITGSVLVGQTEQGAANVRVKILSEADGAIEEVTTNATGRYMLRRVEKQFYSIWIDDDNWVCPDAQRFSAIPNSGPVPSFRVTKGAKLRTRLFDPSTGRLNTAINEVAMQRLGESTGPSEFKQTRCLNSQGEFELRLLPGRTRLQFASLSPREISIELAEGEDLSFDFIVLDRSIHPIVTNPQTGHAYAFLKRQKGNSFEDFSRVASMLTFKGMTGHLPTITSREEHQFLVDQHKRLRTARFAKSSMWVLLGGTDEAEEGVWRWVTGPEEGEVFYRVGENADAFHAWQQRQSLMQPDNNAGRGPSENYMVWEMKTSEKGYWNDLDPSWAFRSPYMLVEFSP